MYWIAIQMEREEGDGKRALGLKEWIVSMMAKQSQHVS